jgi:ectoine hydroxylase-related dioxygenase (phytanoyl-CoA dioxygenase family)
MNDADICCGLVDETFPEIFTTVPPQPTQLKPGQIPAEKAKQFYDEGFLVLDSIFSDEELAPCKEAMNELVDELAHKLYNAGKIKNLYSEFGFDNRLTKIEEEYPGANILLYKSKSQPQAVSNLWANERLLNVVEQLLGTADIDGLPSWNLRPKTPDSEVIVVPWHQDSGYLDNTTYKNLVITAWIPLVNADVEAGCLQMGRYGHKKGKVAKHVGCWRNTWYIMMEEDEMSSTLGIDMEKDIITCPVPYGGCVLFTNLTPHRGLPNTSKIIRWSLDLRFQKAGQPAGYYGLKESIRLRSSTDPNFKIDWAPFTSYDRRTKQYAAMNSVPAEFEVTLPGPWMVKWPVVNENIHTKALETIDRSEWKYMISG